MTTKNSLSAGGRPLEGVSFDLWLTLLRTTAKAKRARTEAIAAAFGVEPDRAFESLADAASRELDDFSSKTGEDRNCADRLDLIADKIGVPRLGVEPRERAVAACQDAARANLPDLIEPDIAETFANLTARGVKIVTVSNTGFSSGATVRAALGRLGLDRYLTAMIFSDEIGRSKPDPVIFEAARTALGCDAGSILHVGDSAAADVAGARAAGFQALHFCPGAANANGSISSVAALTH